MVRVLAVAALIGLAPAPAAANWIFTDYLGGGGSFNCTIGTTNINTSLGAWKTYYYAGSAPGSVPGSPPGGALNTMITYCASLLKVNTDPDAYNVVGPTTIGTVFSPTVANALSYLLNHGETFLATFTTATQDQKRGAIQAAIWKIINPTMVINSFGNSLVQTMYGAVKTAAEGWSGSSGPTDGYLQGLPDGGGPSNHNQDMIWTTNQPPPLAPLDPVPLPATAIGGLLLAGMCLTARRFGICC